MIKLYYFLLIFTIVSCKDHEAKVSNSKGLSVSGSYEVVPDYVGGYKLPEEKINTVYDRYSFTLMLNQNEPESALMLEFLTKGMRIAWCNMVPVKKTKKLEYFFLDFTAEDETDEHIQIKKFRMQIVNEKILKNKKIKRRARGVLLENTEYYCAYIDYGCRTKKSNYGLRHSFI